MASHYIKMATGQTLVYEENGIERHIVKFAGGALQVFKLEGSARSGNSAGRTVRCAGPMEILVKSFGSRSVDRLRAALSERLDKAANFYSEPSLSKSVSSVCRFVQ